jgi:heme/copper-type cytochrome/quinol oxidase subunit 2
MKFEWPVPGAPKIATTVLSAPAVRVQVPVREQSPAQEMSVFVPDPVAVNVTVSPQLYAVW